MNVRRDAMLPAPPAGTVTRGVRAILREARTYPEIALGGLIVALLLVIALFPGFFTAVSPIEINVEGALKPPSSAAWFGTDDVGRDVFARVIHGTRVTLGLVALALGLAAVTGAGCGLVAGYRGGWLDLVLGRVVDLMLSFPPIILGVVITGVLGPGAGNLVLALALVYFPMFFRIARSGALAETAKTYVEAARALGVHDWTILWRHVLRNVLPLVLLQYTIVFPLALQIESALGFLGLGVQPPTPDWGAILEQGKNFLLAAPWLTIYPGLFLLAAALGVLLLGRGLQRRMDAR